MLRNVKQLLGFAIQATDGMVGEVTDLYFDDEDWAIRYLVVDTGNWLSGRQVLISPLAIGHVDWLAQQLAVSLTKTRVEHGPDIDTRKPVSRQHEAVYFGYYGHPPYWEGSGLWGTGNDPGSPMHERTFEDKRKARRAAAVKAGDDCHLRSCKAATGYHIAATDGDIGHVDDLLVDDHTWAIRYIIVDTSNWWGGHRVLIAPQWIEAVSWPDAKVSVDLTRQKVKDAPAYDSAAHLDRQQEQAIYEHYGHPGYWTSQAILDEAQATN
jgi:sporulation protein YlmC with PRC-barrel domain